MKNSDKNKNEKKSAVQFSRDFDETLEIMEAIAEIQATDETEKVGEVLEAIFAWMLQHLHKGNRFTGYVPED